MGKSERGLTLGSTLLVAIILSALGFALASTGVTHLSLMSRRNSGQQALNLAHSVAARGVAQVMANEDHGRERERNETLEISPDAFPKGSRGVLTFNPDEAALLGIPFSTNNLGNTRSVDGSGTMVVPPEAVHLVAEGQVGEVKKRVEVVLHLPNFPYAVACSGPINSQGGLVVGKLNDPSDLEDLGPADILSNATGDRSVSIIGASRITGDLSSAGSIELDQSLGQIEVEGAVRPNEEPVKLPVLDASEYDPRVQNQLYDELPRSSYNNPPPFTGINRSPGDLTITGDVEIDSGVLFVDGDLTVYGGVKGSGLVVTTGNLEVRGGTDLSSHQVALLSEGNMSLLGAGKESSHVQGLLWAGGDFAAREITVVGTVVAGSDGSTGAQFEDSRMIFDPDLARLEFETQSREVNQNSYHFRYKERLGNHVQMGVEDNTAPVLTVYFEPESGAGSIYRKPAMVTAVKADGQRSTGRVELRRNGSLETVLAPLFGVSPSEIRSLPGSHQIFKIRNHMQSTLSNYPGSRAPGFGDVWAGGPPGGGGTGSSTTSESQVIVVDPSKFLDPKDSLRTVLWREK